MKCCLNKRKLRQYAGNSVYAVVTVNDDDDLGDDDDATMMRPIMIWRLLPYMNEYWRPLELIGLTATVTVGEWKSISVS